MLYFIVNPDSGGGRGYQVWKNLERKLENKKIEYRAFLTAAPGDAVSIAEKFTVPDSLPKPEETDGLMKIIAVGGDGTINEVLNGLHLSDRIVLGFIPTGSGNDLAKGLKLSPSPAKCLKRILHPAEIRKIDYGILSYGDGCMEHRRFLNSAGAGFDANVNRDIRKSSLKQHLALLNMQKLSYFFAGAKEFIRYKPVKGYLILENVKKIEFNHIFFTSFHIHPTEGGGYRFAPKADDADGELTCCIVHNHSKKQVARILASSIFGNHLKYAGVRSYNFTEAKIHTDEPVYVHTDGEICGCFTDIEVQCAKQQLKFIF